MKTIYSLTLSLLGLFIIPLHLCANSATGNADEIIDKMLDSYQKQMQDINDITTITEDGVHYQKWIKQDNAVIYKMRNEQEVAGSKQITVYDGQYYWMKQGFSGEITKEKKDFNPLGFYKKMKEMDFEYAEEKEVNGNQCHVIRLEDASLDEFIDPSTGKPVIPGNTAAKGASLNADFYIDAKHWIIRKIEIKVKDMEFGDKGPRNATIISSNKDYKKVNGVWIAHKIVTDFSIEMSEEERAQMKEVKKQMEKMKKKLENMPEQQREMAKKYMKSEMDDVSAFLTTGSMHFERVVKDVKVNQGLKEDLFDGSEL